MQAAIDQQAEKNAIFADFVREALTVLIIALLVLAWGWTSFVGMFDPDRAAQGYLLLALTGILSGAAFLLSKHHLSLAVTVYLATLLASVTLVVGAYHDPALLPLYLLAVLAAAPLTRPRGLGLATMVTILVMLATGNLGAMPARELLITLLLIVLAGLTTWLSTRRLFTALEWALNMTARAQQGIEEAREHRLELQRVLHSLDLALSRLERSNRALVFAQEAAEKAYRFKSEFVANVSHELRTPLNLIVGFSEMMTTAPESYGGKPLPGEYRGDMLAIYRSSRHLLDLINDVLDLSQIESGRMAIHKVRVSLGDLIQDAVDIVRGLAEARRLKLEVELPSEPLAVDLDRIRIRQVLLNLLTNAMRYTEQGWVRITAQIEADSVLIVVQDSGRGIAPERLKRAFEPFDRLDEQELTHGSGLGLAVSKRFVELHDGHMWIDSTPGQGTEVGFSLPLPVQDARLPLSAVRTSRPLLREQDRPLVLLIHDDARALGLLRRYIDACDFTLAESADDARKLMHEQVPDIILVDSAAAADWEAHAAGDPIVEGAVVVVAPLPSVHHVGASLGARDYLPKPVTRDDVAYVLQRLSCRPRTALVIDDDPHIVRLIGRMLRAIESDVHVLEAFDGEEGLSVARAHPPDIIFLDLQMPGLNGEQFIQAARHDAALAETPIVVVSVRSMEQELAPIQGDVRVRLARGFALSELLAVLESVLTGVTRADAVSPTSAASRLAALAG